MSRPANRLDEPSFSATDTIVDAMVRHQIYLVRYAATIRNRFIEQLNETEITMMAEIMMRQGRITNSYAAANQDRVNNLIKRLIEIRKERWDQVVKEWRAEMRQLAQAENEFMRAVVTDALPTENNIQLGDLAGMAAGLYMAGRTLTQWLRNVRQRDAALIATAIRTSSAQSEGPRATARRLIGTRSASGRNGVLQQTRNNVNTVTRTAVIGTSSGVRRQFALANPGVVHKEMFVATLDGRTSAICRSLDGKVFNRGEGEQPPLHPNCRSVRVPLLDRENIIARPARPFVEKRVLAEYLRANRLPLSIATRAALPRGHKTAFDAFMRDHIRTVVGQANPIEATYEQWLRRQSRQFQNDVLGVTRGKLFRAGGLTLDSFVDNTGKQLSLFDLAKRDRDAFVRAGLDPDNPLWESYVRAASP